MNVPEALEGSRGPDREGVESRFVTDEQHHAFLEDPAPDVERELVKEDEVEVGLREEVQALASRGEIRRRFGRQHQAHVDIALGVDGRRADFPQRRRANDTPTRRCSRRSGCRSPVIELGLPLQACARSPLPLASLVRGRVQG